MESIPSLTLVQAQTTTSSTTSPVRDGTNNDGATELRNVLRRVNQRDKSYKRKNNNNDPTTTTTATTTTTPMNGSKIHSNFSVTSSIPNLNLPSMATLKSVNSNHVEMVGLLKSMLDSTLQALKISQEKLTEANKRVEEGQKENLKLQDEIRNLRAQINPPQLQLPPKRKRQSSPSSSRSTSPSSLNHRSDSPPQLSPAFMTSATTSVVNNKFSAGGSRPNRGTSRTIIPDIFQIQKSDSENCMTAHVPYHFYESEASLERTANFEQENDYQINKAQDSRCIEIPSWRKRVVEPKKGETEENLDDQVFLKRHHKWEINERRRKRWDSQRLREESYLEKLKRKKEERELQKKKKQRRGRGAQQNYKENDEEITFQPSIQDANFIRVEEDIPISVFGYPLPIIDEGEFELPWSIESKPPPRRHVNTAQVSVRRPPGRPRLVPSRPRYPTQPYQRKLSVIS